MIKLAVVARCGSDSERPGWCLISVRIAIDVFQAIDVDAISVGAVSVAIIRGNSVVGLSKLVPLMLMRSIRTQITWQTTMFDLVNV